MKRLTNLTKRACIIALLLISLFSVSFGQFLPNPHPPVDLRPLNATHHYQDTVAQIWIPDCSQGVLSTPTQELYKYGNDNAGTPRLDYLPVLKIYGGALLVPVPELVQTMKDRTAYSLTGMNYDRSFDGVSDGNGGAVYAYEKFIKSSEFDGSGNAICIRDPRLNEDHVGYKVFVQGVNSSGSLVSPSMQLDASQTIQINPKIIKSGSSYITVYVVGNPSTASGNSTPYTLYAMRPNWSNPIALSGPESFYSIQEFSVESDQNGGVIALAIIKADSTDTDNLVLLQDIDSNGTRSHSTLTDRVTIPIPDPTSMGIVDNSSHYKYHPMIKYNSVYSKFDLAYAIIDDPFGTTPSATLYMCKYTSGSFAGPLTTAKKVDYMFNGATAMTEFYMTPFSYQGNAAEAVLAKDDAGNLRLWFFDMGTLTLITNFEPTAAEGDINLDAGTASTKTFPGGVYNDNSSPNHIIIVYFDGITTRTCYAAAYNTTTGYAWTGWPYNTANSLVVPNANPVSLQSGIKSTVFQTSVISHGSSLFAVIPDLNQEYISKIAISTGIATTTTYNVRTSVTPNALFVGTDNVYALSIISGSNLIRCNFESGITDFQFKYFTRFQFINPSREYYSDRELNSWNSELAIQSYTTSSLSSNFTNESRISGTQMQRSLHSAAFQNVEATVWESFTSNGVSDIFIAKRDASSSPLQITSGSSSTVKYINPKVACFKYSGTPYACVTYVKEYSSSGTFYSALNYRIVNLSSMSAGSETFIDSSTSSVDSIMTPNFDLLIDSVTHCIYAVYGKHFIPAFNIAGLPQRTDIFAARIEYSGSLNWFGRAVSSPSDPALKTEVVACYTSNGGSAPGIYVAWRDAAGGTKAIMLQFVYSYNATWAGGPIAHNSGTNDRHDPCIAASDKWVMIAWDDTYSGGSSPHVRRIYASGHYNDGSYLPGWQVPVMIDSASIPVIPGSGDDYYESHNPSIVASIPADADTTVEGCLVAFTEDNETDDLDNVNTGDNWDEYLNQASGFDMRIGLRFIWARRIIYLPGDTIFHFQFPEQKQLKFALTTYVNTDQKTALFGTYQQNPKLIQMKPGGFPYPARFDTAWYDVNDSNPNILCVFETMPIATMPFILTESFQVTSGPGNLENFYGIIQEANLDARLVTPLGDATFEHYCVASGQGKQVLGNITHTNELGFLASYLDYGNSDNYTADVKNVSVNNKVFYTMPDTIHVPPPSGKICGDLNAGPIISDSVNITVYNKSACDLNIILDDYIIHWPNMGADGSRLLGGPGGAMSAYSTDNSSFFISYYPQFFCDTARSTSPLFSVLEFFGVYANADYQPNLKQIGSEKIATSHLEPTSPKFTFSVRPNPASNNLIVEVGGVKDRNLSIGIYNILGQQVSVQAFKPSTDDASCTMSIGTLPAGNYLVRVNLDEVYFKEDMISVVK